MKKNIRIFLNKNKIKIDMSGFVISQNVGSEDYIEERSYKCILHTSTIVGFDFVFLIVYFSYFFLLFLRDKL